MARFYFRFDDLFFYMDATTKITTQYPADITSFPTQDRNTRSDHYIIKQPICTMVGEITDIKSPTSLDFRKTGDWIDQALKLARQDQRPVILVNRVDSEETANWFITNFTINQDNNSNMVGFQGNQGDIVQSFGITIQFRQALVTEGLVSSVQPSSEYTDLLAERERNNSSTQQFDSSVKSQEDAQAAFDNADRLWRSARNNLDDSLSEEE